MEINYIEKTLKIISENNYLALATAGKSGKPWVATVFYAFDDKCNFYFFSAKDSLHAKQIRENPSAAVSIFNSMLPPDKVDGVQIECKAEQARIVDLPHLISVYYHRRFPNGEERAKHQHVPMDFRGIALRRFFKLIPLKVYTLDPNVTEVDRRVEVDLAALRDALHAKSYTAE